MKLSRTARHLTTVSVIDAPTAEVWAAVTTPQGINYELRPYMRMTVPRPFRGITIADIAPGTKLGRSFFLLFGIVPIDYDDITVAEIDNGTRFLERSTMMSMSTWTHERTLRQKGERTEVTDAVSYIARAPLGLIPGWSSVLGVMLGFLFRHRHRRLSKLFKQELAGTSSAGSGLA
jgi:ligand-binding SRPBCC domain-containing protein